MLGFLVFAVTLVGSSLAAYWDVRTTEVPDSLSYVVAGAALVLHLVAVLMGEGWWLLGRSVLSGVGLFGFGWLLYVMGMWGGADAFVLGAVGFALPLSVDAVGPVAMAAWPVPVTYLVNVFLVGLVYTIGFAVVAGVRDEDAMQRFYEEVRASSPRFLGLAGGFVVLSVGALVWAGTFSLQRLVVVGHGAVLLLSFLVLYRFLLVVEDAVMVEERDVADLEEGDVIAEDVVTEDGVVDSSKIVGLEADQVEAIRESRDAVLLKHGVMFVPSFPVALVLTVTIGDLVVWLVQMVM